MGTFQLLGAPHTQVLVAGSRVWWLMAPSGTSTGAVGFCRSPTWKSTALLSDNGARLPGTQGHSREGAEGVED